MVANLTDVPMVTFAAMVTSGINFHWLLCLCECARSVSLCLHFLSWFILTLCLTRVRLNCVTFWVSKLLFMVCTQERVSTECNPGEG
jgi:hypothetical protein